MNESKEKPTPEEAVDLKARFEEQCAKAAQALADADVLLLMTGAGWSADSGLAVYADVAQVPAYQERGLEYHDICQPHWIGREPELFYGFWGQCFNDYRSTPLHPGYDIVARWRKDKNQAGTAAREIREWIEVKTTEEKAFDTDEVQCHTPYQVSGEPAGAFFAFSSNVDAHFYDKFPAQEIHDCHGNVELWQCSDSECSSGVWRAPVDYSFSVDPCSMLAPPKPFDSSQRGQQEELVAADKDHADEPNKVARIGNTKGSGERMEKLRCLPEGSDADGWYLAEDSANWPRCGHCKSLARPAILMFGDFEWKYDQAQNIRWEMWREVVVALSHKFKICILEVGCGVRVPTCRRMSEEIVDEILQQMGEATLVRINPDYPLVRDSDYPLARDPAVVESSIPIMSGGLEAVKRIDEIYSQITAISPRDENGLRRCFDAIL